MQNRGFTLIELVVVIIILGILSATVLPKFINIKPEAETATLKGVSASIQGASAVVYGKALIAGVIKESSAQVTLSDGTVVDVAFGYPTKSATQWASLINISDGFSTVDATGDSSFIVFLAENSTPVHRTNDCLAYYLPPKSVGDKPEIGVSDCN